MKLLIVLGLLVAVSADISLFEQVAKEEFEEFKAQFKKVYSNELEESRRLKIFADNKLFIAQHNQKFHKGEETYEMGINEFADIADHEFQSSYTGFNQSMSLVDQGDLFKAPENYTIPKSINWVQLGAVTGVKNQGSCGSCYAFAAAGALESQTLLKARRLIPLSEQNVVDCSGPYGNYGCNGGFMNNAYVYIKENGGINSERDYPYRGIVGRCSFMTNRVAATDRGYMQVQRGSEALLTAAIASVGPISVAIHSDKRLQLYKSGVFWNSECNPHQLNHAVLAVGYDRDPYENEDYYLVKNSWGITWGMKGYVKMIRNRNNNCGIANMASAPIV